MDREEAITELTVHFEHWKRLKEEHIASVEESDRTIESLRMAIEALSAEQVTGKLNNPCDSLLKADSESCKEQKSKLDLISREDAIALLTKIVFDEPPYLDSETLCRLYAEEQINTLPSADRPTELLKDGTLKVKTDNGADVKRVLVWGDDGCGGLYYADDRPSGEWVIVNKGLDIYICDQCGEVEQIQRIPIWDYCPNCGAKMGGNK